MRWLATLLTRHDNGAVKDRGTNPHPGPFRIPSVDSELAGILVAIGFIVMGVVALPIVKWFLLGAIAVGVSVTLLFRCTRKK